LLLICEELPQHSAETIAERAAGDSDPNQSFRARGATAGAPCAQHGISAFLRA
jgi:hypothetical protein